MLTVRDLYCERDDRVLFEGLGFSLGAGEALRIQGSNGSGKTTLLRILCGLGQEYRGELLWQGKPLPANRADYMQALFYLGHSPAINKTLTPVENLAWFCALRGIRPSRPVSEALAAFRLHGYDDIPCYQLSAGQQRRVSLARMCLADAPLWVLDEPFTALDRQGVAELESFLVRHVSEGGALILTTHHALRFEGVLREINLDALSATVESSGSRGDNDE